jgi:hypothetical protein
VINFLLVISQDCFINYCSIWQLLKNLLLLLKQLLDFFALNKTNLISTDISKIVVDDDAAAKDED